MSTLPRPILPSLLLAFVNLAFFSAGCEPAYKPELPTIPMRIGSKSYNLEVADTSRSREKGLMRRDSIPEDHGMIFVFDNQEVRGFWMKNTRFALDILFVDSAGVVVSIKQMKPYDMQSTSSDLPAQYAIELIKGQAEAAGVKVGAKLTLPAGLKSKD